MIGTDYIENLKRFGKNKQYLLDTHGVYRPEPTREQVIDGYPWVFFGDAISMPCFLWHVLYFNSFGMIHSHCATKCFKTCIIPKSVNELFQLDKYLETSGMRSKCGTDIRQYTNGLYLGIVYSTSLEEAKAKENILKEALPDFKIFTKKGCTEFENKLQSKNWVVTPHQLEIEKQLEADVDHSWPKDFKQSEWMKQSIKASWVQAAYASGDETYKETPFADNIKKSRIPFKY